MASDKEKTVRRVSNGSRGATTAVVLMVAIVVMAVATLFMRHTYLSVKNPRPATTENTSGGLFSIKEITVSGDTRYDSQAIIQASGLYLGESIWSVNRETAGAAVVSVFPYIETAEVTNTAYNCLNIAVTEASEIGVMYGDGCWLAVGSNGCVLETRPLDADRPLRSLYLKGADLQSSRPGETAMEERSFAIVKELLSAFEQYGLDGVCEIDLHNKSDIRLNYKNRIRIKLGNDSNLTHEIGVVVNAMPGIIEKYGSEAQGQLDVSAFSDSEAMERAVFTPKELLSEPLDF